MVWFKARSGVAQRGNALRQRDRGVCGHRRPSRWPQQTERFLTREAFRERLLALEQQLQHEHWVTDGPVHVLPDGWPHKPPLM